MQFILVGFSFGNVIKKDFMEILLVDAICRLAFRFTNRFIKFVN